MTLGRTSGETPCGSVFSFTVYCQVGQGLVNFGSEAIFQTESGKKKSVLIVRLYAINDLLSAKRTTSKV